MFLKRTLAAVFFLTLLVPATARAEGLIIPFFGVNFGGDSGKDFGDAVDAKRFNWGASLAVMGGGVVGIEADIGYSPDFYGKSDLGGSSTFTAMGNLLLAVPLGGQSGFGFRPYALGGLGMIRSTVESFGDPLKVEENQFGWDFGGGVMLFFGDHAGLRGELRYFRTFSDIDFLGIDIGEKPGAVDFTRGSLGFIFRF
jgi:hypothetical protein